MDYRISLFFIFSVCNSFLHAFATVDLFLGYNPTELDASSEALGIFNGESSLENNIGSNSPLFSSSHDEECSYSNVDDSDLFPIGRKVRIRSRAEDSCRNPGLEPPNLGLFNPSGGLLDLFTPESPTTTPVQIFPLPGGGQNDIEKLERMFEYPLPDHRTDKTNNEEDPCPADLVSDLNIPVCHSGDYAKDVLRIPGDYFFELFNIRYCTYTVLRLITKFSG